jgi:cytochrome o ubiquinol oxidase operon protein cyoD
MSATDEAGPESRRQGDRGPGNQLYGTRSVRKEIRGYVIGLALAAALTAASFWAAGTDLIYRPGIPIALAALAIAQMGVHLVFFLHMTTAPDNTNNALALAFGVLIVGLVVFGSLWIMGHLNHNMMSMPDLMRMQR